MKGPPRIREEYLLAIRSLRDIVDCMEEPSLVAYVNRALDGRHPYELLQCGYALAAAVATLRAAVKRAKRYPADSILSADTPPAADTPPIGGAQGTP